jgi:L-ascorbate metabolism protein UlaG (beta-lactamase superfamily)
MRYAGAGFLATFGTGLASRFEPSRAQTASSALSIEWHGHTCFLFTGGGLRVLVNPFQTLGCTAGYRPPQIEADLVLISSQLLDEGAIQGLAIPHDRVGGRRFGTNVAWQWTQSGVNVLHMGGAAAPINIEQKILMGRPDVALIPVGGGPKAYNPQEAKQAVNTLNPKIVIPTHFRTQAADAETCDIVPVDEFLSLMEGMPIDRANSSTLTIKAANLPQNGSTIKVLSYQF